MKMLFLTFLLSGLFVIPPGCKKATQAPASTLDKLYALYSDGEISECNFDGVTVYHAGRNAYDAGSEIYNTSAELIGVCHFAWGQVDSICHQLDSCEVIYRVDNNIWGKPKVDKYGLAE